MATTGRYTTILVDGYDLSGQSNSLQIQTASSQLDVTPFQSAARQYIQEPVESSMMQAGYYTGGDAGDFEKTVYDRIGAGSAYVTALLNTLVTACPAYVIPATQASELQIQAPAAGIMTIQAKWAGGTGMKRGLRCFGGVISATGAQAYIDTGGTSFATGGYAFLHVTAITGAATSATITVQSDDNTGFTTPTTHGTFTFSAVGANLMNIVGTIDRYVRLNVTSLGGATNFTVTGVIASLGVTMM